jgi:Holliday junction resolvase RusA-like endonuclease
MEYIFFLKGEVPAKKNSRQMLPNKKNIPSKNYQKWHENALFPLIFQRNSQKIAKSLNCPLRIEITLTHGDLRRRDGDNGESSILDILKDAKIIEDDCWQICRKVSVENLFEKGKPSATIRIIEY